MNATDQKTHMDNLAARLPAALGDVLRSTPVSPAAPAAQPATANLAPSQHLTFAPQAPSAGGAEK